MKYSAEGGDGDGGGFAGVRARMVSGEAWEWSDGEWRGRDNVERELGFFFNFINEWTFICGRGGFENLKLWDTWVLIKFLS